MLHRPGEHRCPRGIGGTHPGRCLCVWNVVTPSGSGHECVSGKPTVRKAQSPGGYGMTREANACRPKGDRKPGTVWSAPPPVVSDNWPDTGRVPGPEGVLTRVRHPMGLDVKLLLVGCVGSTQWPRRSG